MITDDKGTRFLIAFGLPGHANEDDESRAVQSCLEVMSALSCIPAHSCIHDPASERAATEGGPAEGGPTEGGPSEGGPAEGVPPDEGSIREIPRVRHSGSRAERVDTNELPSLCLGVRIGPNLAQAWPKPAPPWS